MAINLSDISGIHPENRTFLPSEKLPSNDFIGLEIELEGFTNYYNGTFKSPFWLVTGDGSLRNGGLEFKFKNPLCGKDIFSALSHLLEFLNWYKEGYSSPEISERTSVHVHLDVRDLTTQQIYVLNLLYITFEKMLFNYCDIKRYYNPHCVPLQEDDKLISLFNGVGTKNKGKIATGLKISKYSAYNTSSIFKFGTIEFRHHPGCYDVDRILEWISIIQHLKIASKFFDVPIKKLPSYVSDTGPIEFVRSIFKSHTDSLLYDNFHVDLLKGIRVAQEIIEYKELYANSIYINEIDVENLKEDSNIFKLAKEFGVELTTKDIEIYSEDLF